ncbi:hypothetical protein RJ60_11665 [Mesotoga sp. B105.6.4]|nr:hypothetical protein RJ60_11665 [Mesotoga sp. B105.6.4]
MKNRSKIRRLALRSISGRKAPRNIGGRKAGKDHARTQGPEKHPGTQGCLRQEAKNIEDERKNTYLKGGFFR